MSEQLLCPDCKKHPGIVSWCSKLASQYETVIDSGEVAMDEYLPSFRLEYRDTYNEYRIVDGHVQFRPEKGEWRTLDTEDIQMHFALRTPVATWIRNTTDRIHHLPLAV